MAFELLRSPLAFLQHVLGDLPHQEALRAYKSWWDSEGKVISEATDRARTPWVRMFDRSGKRVDEILFPPEYWVMLKKGYECGVVWRAFEDHSLLSAYLFLGITAFYDPGLACPYTVSLSTAVPLAKYGDPALRERFLPRLLRKGSEVWQGATWM